MGRCTYKMQSTKKSQNLLNLWWDRYKADMFKQCLHHSLAYNLYEFFFLPTTAYPYNHLNTKEKKKTNYIFLNLVFLQFADCISRYVSI